MPEERRAFNKRERSALFRLAGGRCALCGVELTHGWHADHVQPRSRDGITDVINGQALCPTCNLKKGVTMPPEPLRWQRNFLNKYVGATSPNFLLVACPGAGKTFAACFAARDLFDSGEIDRVLVVVPSATLREQWRKAMAAHDICIDEATANNSNGEMVTIGGERTRGWVITYHSLCAAPLDHRALNGRRRTLVVLDEVHHLSGDGGRWGAAALEALDPCVRRLSLSGTPFRGDQTRIPFVEYENLPDGSQRCRYQDTAEGPYPNGFDYSYGVALTDEPPPVRPVVFDHFDGDVEWMDWDAPAPTRVRVSDEILDKKVRSRANRHVLNAAGEWLTTVLTAADQRLDMTRSEGDPAAKGLVICYDTAHADAVASRLREITTGKVFTAVSTDESGRDLSAEARDIIENFGKEDGRWLVAVQMVTEGVDIPELRVGVYATTVRSALFFRQVLGRVVRRRRDLPVEVDQTSYLFVPKEPKMLELAGSVQDEVTMALIEVSEEDEEAAAERDELDACDPQPQLPWDPFREATAGESGHLVPGSGMVDANLAQQLADAAGQSIGMAATFLAAYERLRPQETAAAPPPATPQPTPEKPRDRLKRRKALLDKLIKQYTGVLLQSGEHGTDYGTVISKLKYGLFTDVGIYTAPRMTQKEKAAAYARADLPAIEQCIAAVTKALGEGR